MRDCLFTAPFSLRLQQRLYFPSIDAGADKVIRHRASSLKDTAHAIFAAELDPEFDRMCEEIKEARWKKDLQTPAQQTELMGAVATRRHHAGAEEQARSSPQGEATDKQCTTNHIKRKIRRRPSWGRGIIRKKKTYKKGMDEEEEEEPEAEVEAVGPSDSCLTPDEESSCDTMGPQPNGHHPHGHHPHVPSTEEESSNEPPVAAPAEPPDDSEAQKEQTPTEEEPSAKKAEPENTEKHSEPLRLSGSSQPQADGDGQSKKADFQPSIELSKSSDAEVQPKHTEGVLVSQADCVNGNESMDSLDSHSLQGSSEGEKRTAHSTAQCSNEPELEEHKDKHKSNPTQEHPPQDGRAETGNVVEHQHTEGGSTAEMSEQLKGITERTEEKPQPAPPHPPLVVDHQRLADESHHLSRHLLAGAQIGMPPDFYGGPR
ncbi:hypothetical protein JOQ06_004419, partial [Pogonophryne albipinna]